MSGIWIVFPPWIYALALSFLGRWGQVRLLAQPARGLTRERESVWPKNWSTIVITDLVFMSLVPISLLTVIGALLPFNGARAGLSLGLLAFMFGCVPARLHDSADVGWDRTLWNIFMDLLRTGGAMSIVGYLVA